MPKLKTVLIVAGVGAAAWVAWCQVRKMRGAPSDKAPSGPLGKFLQAVGSPDRAARSDYWPGASYYPLDGRAAADATQADFQ